MNVTENEVMNATENAVHYLAYGCDWFYIYVATAAIGSIDNVVIRSSEYCC